MTGWTDVNDSLPPDGVPVFMVTQNGYGHENYAQGMYFDYLKTDINGPHFECAEWRDDGEEWVLSGWYEFISHWEGYRKLTGLSYERNVTHWLLIPPVPSAQP